MKIRLFGLIECDGLRKRPSERWDSDGLCDGLRVFINFNELLGIDPIYACLYTYKINKKGK